MFDVRNLPGNQSERRIPDELLNHRAVRSLRHKQPSCWDPIPFSTPFLNTKGSFLLKRGPEAGSQEQSATHVKRGRDSQNFHLHSRRNLGASSGATFLEEDRVH